MNPIPHIPNKYKQKKENQRKKRIHRTRTKLDLPVSLDYYNKKKVKTNE